MGGFRQNTEAKAHLCDDFNASASQLQFLFQVKIGVGHGPSANHTLLPFTAQGICKQFRCVFLHFNVRKIVVHLIALASGVAVNTAVRTASIDVHSVVGGQNPFRLHFVHLASPYCSFSRGMTFSKLSVTFQAFALVSSSG